MYNIDKVKLINLLSVEIILLIERLSTDCAG